MDDHINFEELKKRNKKTAISITVNSENLRYLKEDMKRDGVDKEISLSSIFDMLLDRFVDFLKETSKAGKKIGEKNEGKKED